MLVPRIGVCWIAVAIVVSLSSLARAELPSAAEVQRRYRENGKPFAQVHLRWIEHDETTLAAARANAESFRTNAEAEQKLVDLTRDLVAKGKVDPADELSFEVDGKKYTGEEALAQLKLFTGVNGPAGSFRLPIGPEREAPEKPQSHEYFTANELFRNGGEYQFRSPNRSFTTRQDVAAWTFSDAPLTEESLTSIYDGCRIFSYTSETTPPGRTLVAGDRRSYASVQSKHYTDRSMVRLPPYADFLPCDERQRHPFDEFFSYSAERYQVLREETLDGRPVLVIDLTVPAEKKGSKLVRARGWIDLQRGAVPVRVTRSTFWPGTAPEVFDRSQPEEVTVATEIRELPGGVFYPVTTKWEEFDRDPDAPQPRSADEPPAPSPLVVHQRRTWECSTVEFPREWQKGFFVVRIPEGMDIHDHDTGKLIGALDPQPLVKVGQPAPPLTIARWLDGQPRTLADLRGQVVVLQFWQLPGSICRELAPDHNELRKAFRGKPVTFLSIHVAHRDPEALIPKIEAFRKEIGWEDVAAIDTGTRRENSVTTVAYGLQAVPLWVVIGPDGKVAYVDPQEIGQDVEESSPISLAQFEQRVDEMMKVRFAVAGEKWPHSATVSPDEQLTIERRVERLYLTHVINAALKTAKSPGPK